ncbi:MAG: glycine cleavage system protein GcvH [Candidatus Margulisiibacteriota bacterium]
MIPSDLKYTEEHEWIRVEGDTAIIGITEHAANELGEIVFAELPQVGDSFSQMDEFGSVESVKTVSSLYLPVSGKITEINTVLSQSPNLINDSPYDNGWLVRVTIADPLELDDLMSANQYKAFLQRL